MSQLLNNRYQVLSILGEGAFGKTFLAEDVHMPSRRRCVIKQLKPIIAPTQYDFVKERFQREAAILEHLGELNKGVPKLYAYFANEDLFYLVQEWVEGKTLGQIALDRNKWKEDQIKELTLNLLTILDFIHSENIIHRDIKPDNILIRQRDGKAFLIDFGIVKEVIKVDVFGNPTSSIIAGTPAFMAPEQAAGRPVFASDLYSLGMTAIYLITGKPPGDMIDRLTGDVLWHPFAEKISLELAGILDKATEPNFRDRYKTAKEMMEALQAMPASEHLTYQSQTGRSTDKNYISTVVSQEPIDTPVSNQAQPAIPANVPKPAKDSFEHIKPDEKEPRPQTLIEARNQIPATIQEAIKLPTVSTTPAPRRLIWKAGLILGIIGVVLSLGIYVRGSAQANSVNPGFSWKNLSSMDVTLPKDKYAQTAQWDTFYRQVMERINALPEVQTASAVSIPPLNSDYTSRNLVVENPSSSTATNLQVRYNVIEANYFRTLSLPLMSGRGFNEHDTDRSSAVAIVSKNLSDRLFPGADPVGQRFSFTDAGSKGQWITIIGVVGDVRHNLFAPDYTPEVYVPYGQNPLPSMSFIVRTASDPTTFTDTFKRAVQAVDKSITPNNNQVIEDKIHEQIDAQVSRFPLICAVLAAILSCISGYLIFSRRAAHLS
jgi:serine/threonine-protein kinase